MTKITDILHEEYGNLRHQLTTFFLDWEVLHIEVVEKNKSFHIEHIFRESCGFTMQLQQTRARQAKEMITYTYRHIHAICMPRI